MAVIANFISVRPEMAHTRTAKDWYTFLGAHAENLGVAAKLYEKHTASYFTEAFGNVMYNGSKSESKYQKLNSLMFEWEVEVNQIKRIPFAASVPTAFAHAPGVEIPMAFPERYYEVNDTFMIDESHQLCIVIDGPIRKADDFWEYSVRLVDADYSAELDVTACQAGMLTRWIGNIQPELHEIGFTKYTSNYEKMRGWIGELRCDIDASARYLALEDAFVKVTKEDVGGNKNYLFKMPGMKKVLLDNFYEARNNSLMWQKTTMDENGKCTLHDRQGRELIAGDGLIAQINRYASKYNYTKLSTNVLTEAMTDLMEKCEESTGNTWTFVVNDILFRDLQRVCAIFLNEHKVQQQFMYSQFEQKKIKVGATYGAFEWAGNTIIFRVDRALSNEYPTKGYGILVDFTSDKTSGLAPVQLFTLKDKAFTENHLSGVGVKSGEVATAVAGEKYIVSGYAGIGCLNPYRSYVLIQN